ncbi:hypothetical protein HELRODRAFT_173119 [Helobdella robusta]|uniref:Uncharacterized protein n=1 Tax=Helobdella robusta TaxID=6412 RepID=T1F6E3_HELRO|nr:hypothetical protein HELRODRAFT_173119 [Helobdella robusta]ESO04048.1 hypothetical protein HELRODRAFT_173119 [Helobdella robusta]
MEKESFVGNISDFYTNEDIVAALKLLKHEMELLKIEKFQSRGNTKKDKLFDCVNLFKYLKTNNYVEKCLIFVSLNMAKSAQFGLALKATQVELKALKTKINNMLKSRKVCSDAIMKEIATENSNNASSISTVQPQILKTSEAGTFFSW